MSTRIPRLWQPGNPQTRVFLTDFWIRYAETPRCGYMKLPNHAAKFEVHPQMSRYDVRQYLEKIYKLPVRDVRIQNVMGKIEWSNRASRRYRQAMWKEPDQKFAYVYFKLGSLAQYTFHEISKDEYDLMDKEMNANARFIKEQTDSSDRVNAERSGAGQLLP
ncbi:hypothetical protein M3Y94_00916100 [Aphelenchoides besseyi]|nr:hypothetical protein M3Y94_00916100 [Aphelenchoides besseyi]KAI6223233.1 hypothetical protein M3Y95_00867800 [Aphelenchoides besseyi]